MSDVQTGSFFDLYSRDQIAPDAIDDFVELWHDASDETRPLHEFLGMTQDEYAMWVMDSHSLPLILNARRTNQPLRDAVAQHLAELKAAANPADRSATWALSHWLESHR